MKTFNPSALNLSVVKPGQKTSASAVAEVYTAPTVNKFSIGSLASAKMEVEHGDRVFILEDKNATEFNERFYIAKSNNPSAALLASSTKTGGVGKVLTFNYSGVWSKMIQEDVNALDISPAALERMGLTQRKEGIKTDKKGNPILDEEGNEQPTVSYSALKKVFFEVGEPFEAVVDGAECILYPLVNSRSEEYTPKDYSSDEDND